MTKNDLSSLGDRICILGPSGSGKSTLCAALSDKLGIPGYYLDQIAHIANSDYRFRPTSDWVAEHDHIIRRNFWIIDGNYSVCMRKRFERATGVIRLNPNRLTAVYRFIRRSIIANPDRPGALKGASAEFSWRRVKFTLCDYPSVRRQHDRLLAEWDHLNILDINSMRMLRHYYVNWHLMSR
jgi:adenylate kinase family enzyme